MFNIGEQVQIPGCSTKKRILETSSGCQTLDTLMGGALTGSSLVLIDEVNSRYYADFLVKYFLAEGISHKHQCVLVDPLENSEKLRNSIPTRKNGDEMVSNAPRPMNPTEDSEMKIAWRYGKIQKAAENPTENVWNFQKFVENPEIQMISSHSFRDLYEKIAKIAENHLKVGGSKNLLRLVIKGVSSEIWDDSEHRLRFLALLRSLMRKCWAVCYLIGCSEEVQPATWRQIETHADTHFQIIEFNEEEKKTYKFLGSANGYFHLKSLPKLQSVGTFCPPILDLIFEAHSQKGFQIRVLHLPPALDEPSGNSTCKIDF